MEEPRGSQVPPDPATAGSDDLLGRLDRWLADARTDDAATARRHAHWLAVQADESATFAGLLLDLAERSTPVVVDGPGGRRHRVIVCSVGLDFCIARTDDGRDLLLAFAAVAAVRLEPGRRGPAGDRNVTVDLALPEAVAALGGERPRVLVVTLDGTSLTGELVATGRDVISVRHDGSPPGTTYVPMAAIGLVRLC